MSMKIKVAEERELMKKILDRFYRNYFCWMYRLKLTKMLFENIFPEIFKTYHQYSSSYYSLELIETYK